MGTGYFGQLYFGQYYPIYAAGSASASPSVSPSLSPSASAGASPSPASYIDKYSSVGSVNAD